MNDTEALAQELVRGISISLIAIATYAVIGITWTWVVEFREARRISRIMRGDE